MAVSPITQVINNSGRDSSTGDYYCKMPDGTLIQWGMIDSNGYNGMEIPFPITYASGYSTPNIYLTPYYNAQTSIRCILSAISQTTKFTLYAWDTTTGAISTATNLSAKWMSIGRWK